MKDVVDITKSLVGRKVQLIDEVGELPPIVGDGDRLVQIMYNLIGNAGVDVGSRHQNMSPGSAAPLIYIGFQL